MAKKIEVVDNDVKQASIVFNLLKEGKFEVKGDAFQLAAQAQHWLGTLITALKNAKEDPVEEPVKPKRGAK